MLDTLVDPAVSRSLRALDSIESARRQLEQLTGATAKLDLLRGNSDVAASIASVAAPSFLGLSSARSAVESLGLFDSTAALASVHAATSASAFAEHVLGQHCSALVPATLAEAARASEMLDRICGYPTDEIRKLLDAPVAAYAADLFGTSLAATIAGLDAKSRPSAYVAAEIDEQLRSARMPALLSDADLSFDPFASSAILHRPPIELFVPRVYLPRRTRTESPVSLIADGHGLIVALERALRTFIDAAFTKRYGPGWHDQLRDQDKVEKWCKMAARDAKRRPKARLIEYADFGDLQSIITCDKHWSTVFEPTFGCVSVVQESFRRLNSLRRDTAHSRAITRGDIASIYDNVCRLLVCIDVPLDENLVPEWLR